MTALKNDRYLLKNNSQISIRAPYIFKKSAPLNNILLLACISLPVYVFCLLWPQQLLTNWMMPSVPLVQAEIRKWTTIGVTLFVALNFLGVFSRKLSAFRFDLGYMLLMGCLLVWAFISTAWSINPTTTATYSMILAGLLFAGAFFWRLPERYIRISMALGLVLGALVMGYLFNKLNLNGRNLGGVHPNALGHIGFSFIVMGYIAGGRAKIMSVAVGSALIFVGQSRTVFLGLIAFLGIYHLALPRIRNQSGLVAGAVVAVLGLIIVSVAFEPLIQAASAAATQLLNVTDSSRIGEGFTGRDTLWQNGFDVIKGHELTGYGFRTRGSKELSQAGLAVNAHSGIINAILDIGLVGLLMYAGVLGVAAFKMASSWARSKSNTDRVCTAFLVAMVPILVVEPNYLNFGSLSHFLMLLLLARPLVLRNPSRVSVGNGRGRNHANSGAFT